MKSFLLTSVICMLAAGIYGTIDLTFDLKNGTFIQYEDEDGVAVSQFAASSKGVFKHANLQVAHKVSKPEPTLLNNFSDLNISDFSRGEPPMYMEAMLLEKVGAPDSVVSADVSTAINDTLAAITEKTKTDSLATAKEERKFSLKLYSRGKPRTIKREEVALQIDTAKNH